ncbi:MAG: 30S ribosomal protein S6 [Patescibacteria group bacterium]
MKNGTKYYEFSYLLAPTLSHEDAQLRDGEFRALLGSLDITVDSWDSPKRRFLAYPISNSKEAYLGALRFTSTTEASTNLREQLSKNQSIVRFMLLEWKKALPPRRKPLTPRAAADASAEPVAPTSEKVIDEKLDEILGVTV